MKLLLTGASGFIGNYFINKYSEKYNVQKFSFLNDNFNALHVEGVDFVIHLSALVHQMGGASSDEYDRINVVQTLDLARKAKESGVKQFVFMSSVKVYGEESESAYSEDTVCEPQDEYGKSKLKAERELQKLEDDDFIVSIVRTPIVYGYGVKANIKNLVSLVSKVPVLPFGGIENRRSMVYVGNLCWLVDLVIGFRVKPGMTNGEPGMMNGEAGVTNDNPGVTNDEPGVTNSEASGVFLASDAKPLSTTRLIELIADGLGKKVYLIHVPFFESFLKLVKPSFYKRLYGSLEVDASLTLKRLVAAGYSEAEATPPFSVEDGIGLMLKSDIILMTRH